MCGRFTLKTPVLDWLTSLFPDMVDGAKQVADEFVRSYPAATGPRYNIAPTQDIIVATLNSHDAKPTLSCLRWGLIPHWADSLNAGYSMINARSETLIEKTSFKSLLSHHRCVVIADGYYEWQLPTKLSDSNSNTTKRGTAKQPYWIHMPQQRPFAMAGLWTENKRVREVGSVRSATIITTTANEDTQSVHDRMPVLWSNPIDIQRWLDVDNVDSESLLSMLQPSPSQSLVMHPVSVRVNTPREDEPTLIDDVGG